MNYYFILTAEFVTKYQGVKFGVNQFNAVQDVQGRWVASVNSVTEFPELFVGNSFKVVALEEVDFPRYDDFGQPIDDLNSDGVVTEEELSIWQKIKNWFK
jgi:hypothetical protein